MPCGAPHHAVCCQPEVPLKTPNSCRRARAEFSVHSHAFKARVHGAGNLQPELHQPHILPGGTLPQRRAGVGVGGAIVGLDAQKLVVQFFPSGLAHYAVHCKAVFALEGAYRIGGGGAEYAVHFYGWNGAVVLRQRVQPELYLLHRAAGSTGAQHRAVPCAVGQGAGGSLALAGQLGEVLYRYIDVADLVPCLPPHYAVGGQVELLLERPHRCGHPAAEYAVHRQLAKEGIVLCNAVQLPLQGEYRRAAAALPQRRAGVALRDRADIFGAHDLDAAAVVVAQDLQGAASVVGQRNRAPLLEPRAGDRLAIAVLGIIGVHRATLAQIGVKDIVRNAHHHLKHRASVDVVLVVAGGVGDVEGVALAGVPLGVDAVQRQRDLAVDVRPQCLLRPGGIHLAGGYVGNIIPEGDGHVAGGSCRFAQMHRDIFGNDDLIQYPGCAVFPRLRAAAAAAGKQGVRRDDDGCVRDIPVFLGNRKHLGLRQRYLPGKDLDALNAHGAVAGLCSGQADNGVGAGSVVLVQREGAGGGFNGNIGGAAGGISDAVQGKAVPLHGNGHPLHGGRLACRKGLDAESSGVFHGDTLLCW